MEEEKGKQEVTDMQASAESTATGDPNTSEGRHGPSWRGWVLSILAAILLSVTATLLLGGSGSFRQDRAVAAGSAEGENGSWAGSSCCPPTEGRRGEEEYDVSERGRPGAPDQSDRSP
jgi:hypothetical protein